MRRKSEKHNNNQTKNTQKEILHSRELQRKCEEESLSQYWNNKQIKGNKTVKAVSLTSSRDIMQCCLSPACHLQPGNKEVCKWRPKQNMKPNNTCLLICPYYK